MFRKFCFIFSEISNLKIIKSLVEIYKAILKLNKGSSFGTRQSTRRRTTRSERSDNYLPIRWRFGQRIRDWLTRTDRAGRTWKIFPFDFVITAKIAFKRLHPIERKKELIFLMINLLHPILWQVLFNTILHLILIQLLSYLLLKF